MPTSSTQRAGERVTLKTHFTSCPDPTFFFIKRLQSSHPLFRKSSALKRYGAEAILPPSAQQLFLQDAGRVYFKGTLRMWSTFFKISNCGMNLVHHTTQGLSIIIRRRFRGTMGCCSSTQAPTSPKEIARGSPHAQRKTNSENEVPPQPNEVPPPPYNLVS